jgi:hypothetical protein
MVAVAGKEDAVMKREKHSSFVHAENVEFLPTKVVKAKATKEQAITNMRTYNFI